MTASNVKRKINKDLLQTVDPDYDLPTSLLYLPPNLGNEPIKWVHHKVVITNIQGVRFLPSFFPNW
jgi:hypothetical protein